MKCLTICQPYATAIIDGPKRCENRSWYLGYRGPMLIHAGKSKQWLDDPTDARNFAFGAILGVVDVVDCLPLERYVAKYGEDPWGCFGPYCIRVENPRPFLRPIPYKGQLGLFEVPDGLVIAEPQE